MEPDARRFIALFFYDSGTQECRNWDCVHVFVHVFACLCACALLYVTMHAWVNMCAGIYVQVTMYHACVQFVLLRFEVLIQQDVVAVQLKAVFVIDNDLLYTK